MRVDGPMAIFTSSSLLSEASSALHRQLTVYPHQPRVVMLPNLAIGDAATNPVDGQN